jgi:hypothetical protein
LQLYIFNFISQIEGYDDREGAAERREART